MLDTTYQALVFRWLYPGEVLLIAVMCAVVPWFFVRGPVTRILRVLFGKHARPAAASAGEPGQGQMAARGAVSMSLLRRYLPILAWGSEYTRQTFTNDLIVAVIVTVMLIPQSLAYALLAGLPVQVGLFASMAPLLLYAVFGTSRTLAVGPVAVASLMTAAAVAPLAAQGSPEYLGAAIALAFISGLMLLAMGLLRLGFLANFLSHPVVAGFITASGLQIAVGQLAPVLGVRIEGETFVEMLRPLVRALPDANPYTAAIGLGSLAFLFWARRYLQPVLLRLGVSAKTAGTVAKLGPRWRWLCPPSPCGRSGSRTTASRSSARSRKAFPSWPCRRSTWRCGRRSSCRPCSSRSSATSSRSRSR